VAWAFPSAADEGGIVVRMPQELDGLDTIAALVDRGEQPQITRRQLLGWFNAARRGSRVVGRIRTELLNRKLRTDPDFNEVWVDVPIRVKRLIDSPPAPAAKEAPSPGAAAPATPSPEASSAESTSTDPVHRIGRLSAANQPVVSVPPNTPLSEAVTLMMLKDFSQLPVIQAERDLKGAVTWASIATTQALGRTAKTVNDCVVPAEEVWSNAALFDAIPKIVAGGFVLVRKVDRRFQGIVTVADLSLQFRSLSEPFLLLGQIENLLRVLVARSFLLEDMRGAKNPTDTERAINDVSDLTFGEYVRLLEPMEAWPKLNVSVDRGPFLRELKEVKAIRNDVMHFDPDPLGDIEIALLRNFAAFLERVVR